MNTSFFYAVKLEGYSLTRTHCVCCLQKIKSEKKGPDLVGSMSRFAQQEEGSHICLHLLCHSDPHCSFHEFLIHKIAFTFL